MKKVMFTDEYGALARLYFDVENTSRCPKTILTQQVEYFNKEFEELRIAVTNVASLDL
jgi:hypothetical protein